MVFSSLSSRWDSSKMMKTISSKALVLRINLVFILLFLIVYAGMMLRPSQLVDYEIRRVVLRCSMEECFKKKAASENSNDSRKLKSTGSESMESTSFVEIKSGTKIALINLDHSETLEWEKASQDDVVVIEFDRVSPDMEWIDLFPEWIDEEESNFIPRCPEIPMPEFNKYTKNFDMIVARLPCNYTSKGWRRDVFRLQVHLIAANFAVRNGKEGMRRMTMLFLSSCTPMLELFRCKEMVRKEGEAWVYATELERLREKVSLPIGSCKLALPLWKEGSNEESDLWRRNFTLNTTTTLLLPSIRKRRDAYVTMLHSSDKYACGAVTLAQSLLKTNTTRDLIILVDSNIKPPVRAVLRSAGWTIREIKRIRNPHAEHDTYNKYNYSKLRLWQMTDYDRILFIDSDILVLHNLDILFDFPELSAAGNDGFIFNSGVFVIEPSRCMFKFLMQEIPKVVSYNGGDQGFLNEVFTWWHRLPRRVNFLKIIVVNSTKLDNQVKDQIYDSDPPELFALHYLGIKPWLCFRDYDCNFDKDDQLVFANDVAYKRWWKVHDEMGLELQQVCLLSPRRKFELFWDKKMAMNMSSDQSQHWRINITDDRPPAL